MMPRRDAGSKTSVGGGRKPKDKGQVSVLQFMKEGEDVFSNKFPAYCRFCKKKIGSGKANWVKHSDKCRKRLKSMSLFAQTPNEVLTELAKCWNLPTSGTHKRRSGK